MAPAALPAVRARHLAAGFTTLATGTDIGGSIRIPASACGIVGYKPPHGRNPDGPPGNFDRFNHCGPMTRSVADAALMQNVTSGPHPLDHDSIRTRVKLPVKAESIKGWKIAYSLDFGYVEVDPEVRKKTLEAIQVFRSLGASVEEVDLGWTSAVDLDALHWYNTMNFGRQTIWQRKTNAHLMTDYALKFAEAAERNSTIDDVHKPWARSHAMYQSLGPVLASHDVFICPTNNLAAVKADHDPWDQTFTVNGKKADPEYGWVMTAQFNMLHNCPVLAVPSGHTTQGVPTGIQIVGRTWDDARVFHAGLAYEKALGGWYTTREKRPVSIIDFVNDRAIEAVHPQQVALVAEIGHILVIHAAAIHRAHLAIAMLPQRPANALARRGRLWPAGVAEVAENRNRPSSNCPSSSPGACETPRWP